MRIPFQKVYEELLRILLEHDFSQDRAELCARLFTETSLDGVYSHGINRFPAFIKSIRKGHIHVHALPKKVESFGVLERWDGNMGPGNLNAYLCMDRAIALAKEQHMGCVALRNTNHWMRAGTYGWQAAEAGCLAICFTNTIGNMPPWGGVECRIGNNPLVLAVPRSQGHIVLDIAMSLFSYGKMGVYRSRNELLPFDGGYNEEGNLTRDPARILRTKRPLPIGFWKGSGLSMMLDLLVTILSDGRATSALGTLDDKNAEEIGISQVFLCFDVTNPDRPDFVDNVANELVDFIHATRPVTEKGKVYYPGERTLMTCQENLEKGIPVDEVIWEKVLGL
jgi:3-dehydro-L-gulonate 2-dehydrogenase